MKTPVIFGSGVITGIIGIPIAVVFVPRVREAVITGWTKLLTKAMMSNEEILNEVLDAGERLAIIGAQIKKERRTK